MATHLPTSGEAPPKSRAENTAKVQRRREHARAGDDVHGGRVARNHQDHLIPQRDLTDLDPSNLRMVGTVLAGVQDFKVLRGATAVLSLATSVEHAHVLTDASLISRGSVLAIDIYEIARPHAFGTEPESEEDHGG